MKRIGLMGGRNRFDDFFVENLKKRSKALQEVDEVCLRSVKELSSNQIVDFSVDSSQRLKSALSEDSLCQA